MRIKGLANKISLVIVLILFCSVLKAIEKKDSLLTQLKIVEEKEKANLLNELAYYYQSIDLKESKYFAQQAFQLSQQYNNKEQLSIAYSNLGDIYYFSGKQDTAIIFYKKSIKTRDNIGDTIGSARINNYTGIAYYELGNYENALSHYNVSLEKYKVLKNVQGIAGVLGNMGVIYKYWGETDTALYYYYKSLDLLKQLNNVQGAAGCCINIGDIYKNQGKYELAIKKYLEGQAKYDSVESKFGSAHALNNIGIVYYDWNNYNKALEYFEQALAINLEIDNKRGIVDANSNIGLIYMDSDKYGKAKKYFEKALEISIEINKSKAISNCYNNLGQIYQYEKNYDKAIEYYLRSLEIEEGSGNQKGKCEAFRNLGDIYNVKEDYQNALKYFLKSLEIAKSNQLVDLQIKNYQSLYSLYKLSGAHEKALNCFEQFYYLEDSVFTAEKHKQFNELQTKYETQKKEQQINIQQSDIAKKEAIINKERVKKNAFFIVGLSLLGLVVMIFISLRQKRKANLLLAAQNAEIYQQKEEITAQRDEIETQRDQVMEHRDQISEQNQKITDSINYASIIQDAVLPPKASFDVLFQEFFILNKPRDIVSGDFYWVGSVENKSVIAVSDCTGHGVPGAFMSMLGLAFLNDIVNRTQWKTAADVLNILRNKVMMALHQTGDEKEAKDGMDIALCIVDQDKQTIDFAGANSPIYLVRKTLTKTALLVENFQYDKIVYDNGYLLAEFKGDKMPIGIHIKSENEFRSKIISYQKEDIIYLFSDGYADQFGGPDKRKYKTKNFKSDILTIADMPVKNQGIKLADTIESWMETDGQIDDILVIGVKL